MMKKMFSYIVIVSSFFCLLGAASVLFWQHAGIAFSSRWVLNRVLLALPTSMLFGILAVTQYTKESIRCAMLISLLCIFVIAVASGAMTLGSGIAVVVRFYSVYVFYQKKYLQLHTRTNRSILNYSIGFTPLFVTLVALITSIAMITAVTKHGVGCATIESSFRFPSMITVLETTSLSDLLGVDIQQAQRMKQDDQAEEVSSGLLGGLFLIKERIIDLVVEQKEFLNHTMCGVIDTQLQKIQQRQRWQIAGIALLFILMRPLIALLMRVIILFSMAVWRLLLCMGIVKKKKILVEASTVYLMKGL